MPLYFTVSQGSIADNVGIQFRLLTLWGVCLLYIKASSPVSLSPCRSLDTHSDPALGTQPTTQSKIAKSNIQPQNRLACKYVSVNTAHKHM